MNLSSYIAYMIAAITLISFGVSLFEFERNLKLILIAIFLTIIAVLGFLHYRYEELDSISSILKILIIFFCVFGFTFELIATFCGVVGVITEGKVFTTQVMLFGILITTLLFSALISSTYYFAKRNWYIEDTHPLVITILLIACLFNILITVKGISFLFHSPHWEWFSLKSLLFGFSGVLVFLCKIILIDEHFNKRLEDILG